MRRLIAPAALLALTVALAPGAEAAPATPHQGIRNPGERSDFAAAIGRADARWSTLPRRFLEAILYVESRYDPGATSPTGAAGIAQFTTIGMAEVRRLSALSGYRSRYDASLARRLQSMRGSDAYDPDLAIEAAALTLQHYLARYDGDLAATATFYNAGGNAAAAVRRYGHAGAKSRGLLTFSQASTYWPHVKAAMDRFAKEDRANGSPSPQPQPTPQPQPQDLIIEITASSLNVRAAVWGSVLGQVRSGQRFVVRGESSGWYAIDFQGRRGWISGKYARRVSNSNVARINASALNVRSGPSTGYRIVGLARRGDRLVVTGRSGSWVKVQFGTQQAWIYGGSGYASIESATP